jgi:hypothetical protein
LRFAFYVQTALFSGGLGYWRSANAKSELPAATATYWRPPTAYVIGPDATWPPTVDFQSSAPVLAFNAKK